MSKYCAKHVNSQNRALVKNIISAIEARPNNIDFSGRTVAPEIFPTNELKLAAQEVLRVMGAEALQYSSSHDYIPLKEQIAARYAMRGLMLQAENFTITNGLVQAVDMAMKVLVNAGDTILVEAPLSWRLRQTMTMYRPQIIEIPVTEVGIDIQALEDALKNFCPKFFFCSPNYQEPTGVIYSAENREAIATLMQAHDCVVVEMDEYVETGCCKELPYICSLVGDHGVLLGSVAQLIGPGLRIGWVVAQHPVLVRYFTEAKQKTDSHANGLIQRVLWQYMVNADMNVQAEKVRTIYAQKRSVAIAAWTSLDTGKVSFRAPEGGTFLWLTFDAKVDGLAFAERAIANGVTVLPGKLFGNSEECAHSIYLNYGGAEMDDISKGIATLSHLV